MTLLDVCIENETQAQVCSSLETAKGGTQAVNERMGRCSAALACRVLESWRFQRTCVASRRIGAGGRFIFRDVERRCWRRQSSRSEEQRAAVRIPASAAAALFAFTLRLKGTTHQFRVVWKSGSVSR